MFPIDVPAGTTLDTLITDVVPRIHGAHVKEPAREDLLAVVELRGGKTWSVTVNGSAMSAREGETRGAAIFLSFDREVAQRFLDDWMGPKKYVPKKAPPGGLVLLSDPRVMKRVMMASGAIELAIDDFEGERISMIAAFGDKARKGFDYEDTPDVVVEAKMATLEALLEGQLAPEAALSSGDVKTKGNRFFAMQLALALAPFFAVAK